MTLERPLIRRDRFAATRFAAASAENLVTVEPETFVVEGRPFPRRQFPERAPIERLRHRTDPPQWESQLTTLPDPTALQAEVPSPAEVFTYLSPSMARV